VYEVLSPDTPIAALLSQMRINPAATIKTYKLSRQLTKQICPPIALGQQLTVGFPFTYDGHGKLAEPRRHGRSLRVELEIHVGAVDLNDTWVREPVHPYYT